MCLQTGKDESVDGIADPRLARDFRRVRSADCPERAPSIRIDLFWGRLELLDPPRYCPDLPIRQAGRTHRHAGSQVPFQYLDQHALLRVAGDEDGPVAGAPREQSLESAQVKSAGLSVRTVACQAVLSKNRLDFGLEGVVCSKCW